MTSITLITSGKSIDLIHKTLDEKVVPWNSGFRSKARIMRERILVASRNSHVLAGFLSLQVASKLRSSSKSSSKAVCA